MSKPEIRINRFVFGFCFDFSFLSIFSKTLSMGLKKESGFMWIKDAKENPGFEKRIRALFKLAYSDSKTPHPGTREGSYLKLPSWACTRSHHDSAASSVICMAIEVRLIVP